MATPIPKISFYVLFTPYQNISIKLCVKILWKQNQLLILFSKGSFPGQENTSIAYATILGIGFARSERAVLNCSFLFLMRNDLLSQ